jgi:hypothetical protein
MEKEHQRREELKNLDEEHRKQREEEYERMKKRHEEHPKVHHPVSLYIVRGETMFYHQCFIFAIMKNALSL